MGIPVKPYQVERTGIRAITSQDIREASKSGQRWKLVCSAERDGDQVRTLVAPRMVKPDSPLFHVNGTSSVIQFETDVLSSLSLIEADPGPHTTAYGLLADFLNAARE
jgi:homoserine dehydrogenase